MRNRQPWQQVDLIDHVVAAASVTPTGAWPRLGQTPVLSRAATRIGRCGVPTVVALVLLLAQVSAAQGETWQGKITLTRSTDTLEQGVRESQRVEERWTDFIVHRAGRFNVSFRATWTLTESRSSSDEDCSTTGHAAGTEPYPWFVLAFDPFDESRYELYSGGTGGGPDVRGTRTRTCRNREPVTSTYLVMASWLQSVGEHSGAAPFAVAGRIDPEHPRAIRGSTAVEVEGGKAVLAWDLVRPSTCDDTATREHLAREAGVVRDARTSDDEPFGAPEAHASETPLAAADVEAALVHAIGTPDHVTLRAPVESGEAGVHAFAVRLGGAGGTLPTLEHVLALLEITCVDEASFEGARLLVVGSVQWVGHRFRITLRVVDVETGAILDVVQVDGSGSPDDLSTAVGSAFARAVAR
jgi:hypothetical protein